MAMNLKIITLFLLIGLVIVALSFSIYEALAISAGMLWGYGNFYLIQQLSNAWLLSKDKNFILITIIALIKFPLLYWIGYQFLKISYFSPWMLLIGFSFTLVVHTYVALKNSLSSEKQT